MRDRSWLGKDRMDMAGTPAFKPLVASVARRGSSSRRARTSRPEMRVWREAWTQASESRLPRVFPRDLIAGGSSSLLHCGGQGCNGPLGERRSGALTPVSVLTGFDARPGLRWLNGFDGEGSMKRSVRSKDSATRGDLVGSSPTPVEPT